MKKIKHYLRSQNSQINTVDLGFPGFLAISIVLLISTVVLVIATTVSLVGIGEAQSSYSLNSGESNLALVEGCVDDYLLKIRTDPNYAAADITRPGGGTCKITITSRSPSWDITVSDSTSQRKIQVIFSRTTDGIQVKSWREI
jgi:hypothetical protein